ncbi:MAG TPA: carbon storage regulator CsrA [Pirellulales bacterium]|jgi:carbon storage regulator|nr:carbon storage regulator CsrA [Pirellulales bacterium]
MLVLSRKINERIQIGDEITITVVRISDGNVRIGINAPSHLLILRDELATGDAERPEQRLARPVTQ